MVVHLSVFDLPFASDGDAVAVPDPYTVTIEVCTAAIVVGAAVDVCTPIGTAASPITTAAQGYAWALVQSDALVAQPNVLVTYSLANQFGVLETLTALTDTNGQASVGLVAGVDAGAGIIAGDADVLGNAITDSTGFETSGGGQPVPYQITSIICENADDITCSTDTVYGVSGNELTAGTGNGIVHALVTDFPGLAVQAGVVVDFSLSNTVGVLISTSAITDALGIAVVQIGPSDVLGAGTITASADPDGGSPITVDLPFASDGDAVAVPDPYTVTIEVCNAAIVVGAAVDVCTPIGTAASPVTTAAQGYAWALVQSDALVPQANILVTYSLANAFGVLETLTALTDVNGQASVGLLADVDAGAGIVTGDADVLGNAITDDEGFETSGGGEPVPYQITSIICENPDDITCSGDTVYGVSGNELTAGTGNGYVHALVTDFPGLAIQADVVVDFSLSNTVGVLISISAITDALGIAVVPDRPK